MPDDVVFDLALAHTGDVTGELALGLEPQVADEDGLRHGLKADVAQVHEVELLEPEGHLPAWQNHDLGDLDQVLDQRQGDGIDNPVEVDHRRNAVEGLLRGFERTANILDEALAHRGCAEVGGAAELAFVFLTDKVERHSGGVPGCCTVEDKRLLLDAIARPRLPAGKQCVVGRPHIDDRASGLGHVATMSDGELLHLDDRVEGLCLLDNGVESVVGYDSEGIDHLNAGALAIGQA